MADPGKRAAAAPTPSPAGSPLVVACLDPADLRPDVNPLSGEVSVDRRRADLSAPDSAALELALRAAEDWGGRVLAIAAGPASVEPALRSAMALGAQALRVPFGSPDTEGPEPLDPGDLAGEPSALAQALATAIGHVGSPALVLCGDRSPTRGIGAVPALIAHYLGAAQALGLVKLSVDKASLTVLAERRLDGGWRETLRLRAPAVCSVEAAGVRLRRATLAATLHSVDQPVQLAAADGTAPPPPSLGDGVRIGPAQPYRPRTKVVPAPSGDTRDRLLALTGALRSHDPPRLVGPVDPERGASELLDFLTSHGYLSSAEIGA